jgi:cation diffusion facilitator CzcD-associated flavoprotein CzcO
MQFRELPMPRSFGDFPTHCEMTAYFERYARAFDLRRRVRFRTAVERVEPAGRDGWRLSLRGGQTVRHSAVVVANGHHWAPRWPELPGTTTAAVTHAHDYRTPAPFAERRVLVIGGGQSAVEIGVEVSRVAARTVLAVRSGTHFLPRRILGRPYDLLNGDLPNRLPWPLLNRVMRRMLRLTRYDDPASVGFPAPAHRLLDQIPAVSSELAPAIRRGAIAVRPAVASLDGAEVRFADGSTATVDAIVCATGYRVSFPFLSLAIVAPEGTALPLYRRIVPLDAPGLYFIGLVDAPSGLLPIVERQSAWLADVLEGRITMPDRARMLAAIDAGERRSRERFPDEPAHTIRCDPHAYMRVLARDLRRARLRAAVSARRVSGGESRSRADVYSAASTSAATRAS